jgi:signal transduction histidine kinase
MGEGIIGRVAEQRRAIVLEQVERSDDPNTKFLKALRIRAYACYPLLAGEHLLGTLSFASRQRENFAPEDVEFFQTVASYLALAKERLRLRDELQRHAANLEQTVRERTCKLRDLVAELEHMSYSIVHDLRAPLRAIEGFTTIILRNDGERLSPASRGLIERMLTATNRMDLLISDVLNYNKAVREELPLHPVDVGKLLREMLSSYPEFQPPRVEMSLEGEFPPILGNEAGLGQCFSNVLNNAVKFVKPGMKPCVRVWAEVKGPPDVVRVWVEDCGTGIPKEGHKRIFDMFQRMHGSDYEGTGIGLALVRKVMDRMGGRVGVESEPGKGSRFWLELNRAPERPYPPAPNGSVSSLGGDEHVQNQKAA